MRSRNYIFFSLLILSVGLTGSAYAGNSPNLYRNKEHAFSIVFPPGWHQRSGQTPHTIVVSENQQGDSIIIQVRKLPENITLNNYPNRKLRALTLAVFNELKHKFADAIMADYGITYICNEKTIWMRYTYSVKQPFLTTKMTVQHYIVWHGGEMYGILCSASPERYTKVSSTLLNSVRSFLFEDPQWYRE